MKRINENTKVTLTVGQLKQLIKEARIPEFDSNAMKDALTEIASRCAWCPGKFNRDTAYSGRTWTSYVWTTFDDTIKVPTTDEIREKHGLPEGSLLSWHTYGVRFPKEYEDLFRSVYKNTTPAKRTAVNDIEKVVTKIALMLVSKGVKYEIGRAYNDDSFAPWCLDVNDKTKVTMEDFQKILRDNGLPYELNGSGVYSEVMGPINVKEWSNSYSVKFPYNSDIRLVKAEIEKLKKEQGLDKITYQECPNSVKSSIKDEISDLIERDKIWDPSVSFSFDVERGVAKIDVYGGGKAYGDSFTVHKWATGRYNPHNKTYNVSNARYSRRTSRGGGFGDGESEWRDEQPKRICNIVKEAFDDASLTVPGTIFVSITIEYD